MNELDGIKQFTTVVADSGDIESIRHYHPQDATTNPSLLLKAAGLSQYEHLIDDAIAWGKKNGKTQEQQVVAACDKLAVNFGADTSPPDGAPSQYSFLYQKRGVHQLLLTRDRVRF